MMINPLLNLAQAIGVGVLAAVDRRPLEAFVGRVDQIVAERGKLPQQEALYTPVPVFLPLFWDYRCSQCRQFTQPDQCKWVDGKIEQDGWCSLWVAPEGIRPFSWLTRPGEVPKVLGRLLQRPLRKR